MVRNALAGRIPDMAKFKMLTVVEAGLIPDREKGMVVKFLEAGHIPNMAKKKKKLTFCMGMC